MLLHIHPRICIICHFHFYVIACKLCKPSKCNTKCNLLLISYVVHTMYVPLSYVNKKRNKDITNKPQSGNNLFLPLVLPAMRLQRLAVSSHLRSRNSSTERVSEETLCQIIRMLDLRSVYSPRSCSSSYFNTKLPGIVDVISGPAGKRAKIITIIAGVFIDLSPMPTPERSGRFPNEPCDHKRDRAKNRHG